MRGPAPGWHRLWVRVANHGVEYPEDVPTSALPVRIEAVGTDLATVLASAKVGPPPAGEREKLVTFAWAPAGMAGIVLRFADGEVCRSWEPFEPAGEAWHG